MEAIALTLLNRHPLSARRPHHSANSGSSVSEDSDVPKIDFAAGVPDIDTPVIRDWVMAEQAAFEGKTVYDEISQLNVTEVAVSQTRQSVSTCILILGHLDHHSAIFTQTMGVRNQKACSISPCLCL